MADDGYETRDQVLAASSDAGFAVTAEQLARWHRAGLLARPEQKSLGRGRGTVTVYPPGTAAQTVALCGIRSRQRSLGRAAFELWWEGFSVDPAQVRAALVKAAMDLDTVIGVPSEANKRSHGAVVGLLSRRLGRERTEKLAAVLRDQAGRSTGKSLWPSELDMPAMPPSVDELLEIVLPLLASAVPIGGATALVGETMFDEICVVRDDTKAMFQRLSSWAEPMAWLWGRKGAVFRLLADMPKFISPAELPDLVLAALLVRRVIPAEVLTIVLNSPTPQLLREVAAMKTVYEEVPGADSVFTPQAIRALLRNKEAARRYLPSMRAFVAQHEVEINKVMQGSPLADP